MVSKKNPGNVIPSLAEILHHLGYLHYLSAGAVFLPSNANLFKFNPYPNHEFLLGVVDLQESTAEQIPINQGNWSKRCLS